MTVDGIKALGSVDPRQLYQGIQRAEEPDGSFANSLKNALAEVSALQNQRDEMVTRMVTGEVTEAHEVMVAAEEAQLAFELLMEVRNRLLEVLNEEYILSARARGLKEKMVIFKHALRNAMIPLVTILGLHLPALLSGSVLIESIFAWPGMGTLAVNAVGGRDYPVMMATLMISAVLTIVGNLLADITYVALDPRVSYEKKKPV